MDQSFWTYFFVILTFGIYIGIAIWSRAGSTEEFYVAGHDVHPTINGMATAADWMSAASFLSMAGLIAFLGYGGSVYLMGWTGGYVLLALLLAPFLREFGKFTVPDFVGDRYYSKVARVIAVICALFVSFTYIAGQMKGVGVAFSGFLGVPFNAGILIGMGIVFVYAVLGGMKGHYLYAGRAICGADLRLYCAGDFHLFDHYRKHHSAAWFYRQCGGNRCGYAGKTQHSGDRSWF